MSKTKYIVLNADRETIYSIEDIKIDDESIEVSVDDDFDDMKIDRYRYTDGSLVLDDELSAIADDNMATAKIEKMRQSQTMNLINMLLKPQMQSMTFTASTGSKVGAFADEWESGVRYEPGNIRLYNGQLYVVNDGQGHTSQVGWEPPNAPSLWSLIKIAPDGNREWVEPAGAHNDYEKDELCWYPDYDTGNLYKSKQNGNVWPPNDTPQSTWIKLITW